MRSDHESCRVVGCPCGNTPRTASPEPTTGTAVSGPQIPAQTIDGRPLTGPEIISRTLVLVAGTSRHNRDELKEIADELDAVIRGIHYRAAAESLRAIATSRTDSAPDAVAYQHAVGIHEAADRLDAITIDLDHDRTHPEDDR